MGRIIDRRRVMGNKKGLLPSGYTQLEYVNTGTGAYINTGVTCDHTNGFFLMNYRFNEIRGGGVCGQGRNINQDNSFGAFYLTNPYYLGLQYFSPTATDILLEINVWHSIEFNDGNFIYDRNVIFSSTGPLSGLWGTFCFGKRYSTAHNMDIGECKLLNTHHLIPALRNVDNVAGFYNLISNEFLESSNPNVPFIAGPVV